MRHRILSAVGRPRNLIGGVVATALVVAGFMASAGGGTLPDLPTADVKTGEFVDTLEIRGEIRPLKSIVVTSPLQSGDLQIVKLARNGSMVKAGEVVVKFDGSTLQRTIQEKQSELKQSEAEIEQAGAQGRLTAEQNATALMKAKYNIDRARLDINRGETVSRIENEKAKLVLADAEQKLLEIEEKIKSDKTSAEAEVFGKQRKREKALADLQRAQLGLQKLEVRSPADGMINILTNYRSGGFGEGGQEFREGDRAWPGAAILELPDLSSIHLEARLEEADRGRLNPGQDATVRIEAVPGRDFKARIERISLLARPDFASGWPPPRNFDLGLILLEGDPRIRPGMTAVARIATERIPGVMLVPAEAIFQRDGSTVVYAVAGTKFEERRVDVSRRGREQAIVTSGLAPGDRIATRRPGAALIRRTP